MKKEIVRILSFGFAFFLCVSLFAQNEKDPVKVIKNRNQQGVEVQPPPPPPPPPPPMEEAIFKVVEDMPRFPGCEGQGLERRETEQCAKDLMLEYIYKNLNYPEEARNNGTEGMAVVQFIVGKDGNLRNGRIVRDPGDGCGDAALGVITKMQEEGVKWIAGKQRGRNVSVQYTLPVKFKL